MVVLSFGSEPTAVFLPNYLYSHNITLHLSHNAILFLYRFWRNMINKQTRNPPRNIAAMLTGHFPFLL